MRAFIAVICILNDLCEILAKCGKTTGSGAEYFGVRDLVSDGVKVLGIMEQKAKSQSLFWFIQDIYDNTKITTQRYSGDV